MALLSQQRCLNHGLREAVARCPECGQFYCRECVVEHDDRLMCAACLKKLTATPETSRWRLTGLVRLVQAGAGIVIVWLFFYVAGRSMLGIETAFHDKTLWMADAPDD